MAPLHGFLLLFVLSLLRTASEEPLRLPDDLQPRVAASVRPRGAAPADQLDLAREGAARLARRDLLVPVQGVARARVQDNFDDARGSRRKHKAIDIMAPWGTPVLAADDGRVVKISRNRAGGLAVYQQDPSGQFVYYYAHLAGYVDGLREGQVLRRGDVIGYVGTTGNAPDSAPHLHFAVQLIQQRGRWWGGEPINPYEALAQGEQAVARP